MGLIKKNEPPFEFPSPFLDLIVHASLNEPLHRKQTRSVGFSQETWSTACWCFNPTSQIDFFGLFQADYPKLSLGFKLQNVSNTMLCWMLLWIKISWGCHSSYSIILGKVQFANSGYRFEAGLERIEHMAGIKRYLGLIMPSVSVIKLATGIFDQTCTKCCSRLCHEHYNVVLLTSSTHNILHGFFFFLGLLRSEDHMT